MSGYEYTFINSNIKAVLRSLGSPSIVGIWIHNDGTSLAIVVGGTDYMVSVLLLECEGDCLCSYSFIEQVSNPEAARMARFHDWVEAEIGPDDLGLTPDQREAKERGELKFYFYRLLTDKGETTIEMRNESNGYYGGTLYYKGITPFLDFDFTNFSEAKE